MANNMEQRNWPRNLSHFMELDPQEPTTNPILSQINPIHTFVCYFFKICFNIIISSIPRTTKCSRDQNFLNILVSPIKCCMSHPPHPLQFDYHNNIWWIVQIMESRLVSAVINDGCCLFFSQQIDSQRMYIILFQVGVMCYDNKQQYKSSVEQYRMMSLIYWSEHIFIVYHINIELLRKSTYPF